MIVIPYLLAILKNVIYGSTVYFTSSLTKSCDVLDILALRFLLSFTVMWLLKVTGILRINVGVRNIFTRRHRTPMLRSLMIAALFEPVLYMLFETLGISMTTNVTAAVIISLSPIAACILEVVVLKEYCSFVEKTLLGIGIVGVAYVAVMTGSCGGENNPWGILLLFLAVISGGMFSVFSRKSSKTFAPMEVTYFSCMLGALAFNSVNIVRHIIDGTVLHYFDPYFDLGNIVGFVFLGIISTIVATGVNNLCLSSLQVSTVSAFGGLSTVVTILIGVFIGGEQLYYYHYIGMALIAIRMIGVSLISIRRTRTAFNLPLKISDEAEMSKSDTK
jgi:drug/metabolite transporter (DMT)-like permease